MGWSRATKERPSSSRREGSRQHGLTPPSPRQANKPRLDPPGAALKSCLPRERFSISRQVHFLEQRRVARIDAQVAQEGVALEVYAPGIFHVEGAPKPEERLIQVPLPSVDLGDLVRRTEPIADRA